jgi:hypothetical protein
MEEVFKKFNQLFTKRCDNYSLLSFGEDSVRYDFFCALSSVLSLEPWEIRLESAANPMTFIPRNNENSKRKEKPMLDLIFEKGDTNICVEFALFRQNSNEDGTINKTERTVKMLNDMVRVALESEFSSRTGYFVCVADDKMLGHQLRNKMLGRFPSDYLITEKVITTQQQSKTCKFDLRFIDKFLELNKRVKSTLIFNEEIKAAKINRKTKILIWIAELVQGAGPVTQPTAAWQKQG